MKCLIFKYGDFPCQALLNFLAGFCLFIRMQSLQSLEMYKTCFLAQCAACFGKCSVSTFVCPAPQSVLRPILPCPLSAHLFHVAPLPEDMDALAEAPDCWVPFSLDHP